MDYPHNLKFLSRSPLSLDRIPSHLCCQIILKQSAASIFNLPHTNSRYSSLVEVSLSLNPNMVTVQGILQKLEKISERKEILHYASRYCESMRISMLFPASNYGPPTDNVGLYQWVSRVYSVACGFVIHKGLNKQEIIAKIHSTELFLADLWSEQQQRGPRKIALQTVPELLLRKILAKTTALSALRLAKTFSAMTTAFDGYVQSMPFIQILIESAPLLANDTESIFNVECRLRFRRRHFMADPLLLNSYRTCVWPSSIDLSIIEEMLQKHDESISSDYLKNKDKWLRELLGHTYIPKPSYSIMEKN